ncbi:hypothetical protein TNCV_1211101 [Trichonephila clavipes]|nr:hypothetical protein TNCV_1211101 [Trichonephila clavipes]
MIRRLPYQFFIPPLLSGFLPPYSNGAKEPLLGAKAPLRKQRRVDKRAKWSAGARQKRRKKQKTNQKKRTAKKPSAEKEAARELPDSPHLLLQRLPLAAEISKRSSEFSYEHGRDIIFAHSLDELFLVVFSAGRRLQQKAFASSKVGVAQEEKPDIEKAEQKPFPPPPSFDSNHETQE